MADNVNHPEHYKAHGLETIDVIEAFTKDLTGVEATDTGNILKYACRWKKKNGIEDLKKLVWYANHLIEHLSIEEKNKEDAEKLSVKEGPFFTTKMFNEVAQDVVLIITEHINKYGKISVYKVADILGRDDKELLSDFVPASYELYGWNNTTDFAYRSSMSAFDEAEFMIRTAPKKIY